VRAPRSGANGGAGAGAAAAIPFPQTPFSSPQPPRQWGCRACGAALFKIRNFW